MGGDKINRRRTSLIYSRVRLYLGSHLYKVQPTAVWKWQRYCFISSAPYNQYPLAAATDEPVSYGTSGGSNIQRLTFDKKKGMALSDLCVQNEDLSGCGNDLSSASLLLFSGFGKHFFNISLKWLRISNWAGAQGEGEGSARRCAGALCYALAECSRRRLGKCDRLLLRGGGWNTSELMTCIILLRSRGCFDTPAKQSVAPCQMHHVIAEMRR